MFSPEEYKENFFISFNTALKGIATHDVVFDNN